MPRPLGVILSPDRSLRKILAALAGVATFLVLASVISPSSSTAFTSGGRPWHPDRSVEGPSLGTLEGGDYRVSMAAGTDGEPRYTVWNARGRLLASGVTADELYRIDPDLDPASMIAVPTAEVDDFGDF